MSDTDRYAGVDLGGTKVLTLIADASGNVLGEVRIATLAKEGPEAVQSRVIDAIHEAATQAQIDAKSLRAIGVSAPGPVDAAAGVVTDPPNLAGWHNVPLARILRERAGAPTVLENDANCSAVGEHSFGAGRGYKDMVFMTISTGIGGGIIIENEVYAGASGAAGELGHIGVALDGPVCGAGHVGCLEAFASGTAIAARARDLIAAGLLPQTARLAAEAPPLSAETVYLAAMQGEAEALEVITRAAQYLGIGLASVINAFNPQALVLGGGLTNMGDVILGPAVETARSRSFGQSFMDVRIVEGELGERSAALGALAVARDRVAKGTI